MRFRHDLTGKNRVKRVVSFLLMLCLLVPMLPSSIGLDAQAEDNATTSGDTVTIKLHDLYIDRKEALPDETKLSNCLDAYLHARKITVEKGTKLSDALTNNNVELGTKSLADTGVYKSSKIADKNAMTSVADAKNCVWYTRDGGTNGGVDGNNARNKFDFNTAIDDNLLASLNTDKDTDKKNTIDLYTYSYRIRLITGKDTYKDLIVREGQKEGFVYGDKDRTSVSIEEFLKDNNVTTSWTDVNKGETLSDDTITALKEGKITRNYALRAAGVEKNTVNISCKVAVNGQWTDAGTIKMDTDRVDVWGRTGPALNYYVTDSELKDIYKDYGFGTNVTFKTGEISKKINGYFPFRNGGNLYIRQMPKYETVNNTTQFRVPLVEDTTTDISNLEIYYTPHNTEEYESKFLDGTDDRNGWASVSDSAVLKENSFYTVSVDSDDKNNFSSGLPNTKLLYGESGSFGLPLKDKDGKEVKWYVEKGGDNVTITTDSDKATVTIKNIEQEVVLTTNSEKQDADAVKVHCYVLIDGKEKEVSTLHFSESQHEKHNEWGNNERYYVSTQTLEEVYADYGFKASEYNGERYFPNTVHTTDKYNDATLLWANATAVSDNSGYYKVPLTDLSSHDDSEKENKKNIDVVYTPHNQNGYSSYFGENQTKGKSRTDNTLLTENSFFSVTVKDEANAFTNPQLPDTQYILSGKKVTVKLPYSENDAWTIWYCSTDGNLKPVEKAISNLKKEVDKDNNTMTITLSKVSNPILITTNTYENNLYPLKAFVAINGKWQQVKTELTGLNKEHITSNSKYYITAEELELIYGKYGFQAADNKVIDENRIFGIGNGEKDKIWADVLAKDNGNSWYYPTLGDDQNLYLYYLPNNIKGKDGFWGNGGGASGGKSASDALSANTFYTIDFEDPEGKFSADAIPDTQYALTGTDKTVTLPYQEGVNWFRGSTKLTPVENSIDTDKGTAQYTISNVTQATTITTDGIADDEIPVEGYISLNGAWTKISSIKIKKTQGNITSSQLETLFGACGFKASTLTSDDSGFATLTKLVNQFPCKQIDSADNPIVQSGYYNSDDNLYSVQINTQTGIAVYYVPKPQTTNVGDTLDLTDTTILKNNKFYSISFADPSGEVKNLPKTMYRRPGSTDIPVQVPHQSGVTWYIVGDTSKNQILVNQTVKDDEVSFTIPSISESLTVTTQSQKKDSVPDDRMPVNIYVAIDDQWVCVTDEWTYTNDKFTGGSLTVPKNRTYKKDENTEAHWYITEDELKNVLGVYGFTGIQKDENHFPHTTMIDKKDSSDPNKIWADQPVIYPDSEGGKTPCIQLNVATGNKSDAKYGIAVYYTPNSTWSSSSAWKKTDDDLLAANSLYYTVSAADIKNQLTDEQKKDIIFPKEQCLARGGSTTYTLPTLPNGLKWIAVNKNTHKNLSRQSKLEWNSDKTTCTISNITEPIQFIVSDDKQTISYDPKIERQKLTDTDPFNDPSKQTITKDGSIQGKNAWEDVLENNGTDYVVRSPDTDYATTTIADHKDGGTHPRTYYYTFQYWQVDNTDITLSPGDKLSEKIPDYENYPQISLTAVWTPLDTNNRPTTVNFYVSLTCEIKDSLTNGVDERPKSDFSESVYATRILGTDKMNKNIAWEDKDNSMFSIVASDSTESAYSIDSQLRQMVETPIPTKNTQGEAQLQLESFPSDETVLANLRDEAGWSKDAKIKLGENGPEVAKEDLTTDNFTVRWYVLKYQRADAWHIDGVLVAKEAHAVVTKTFSGNQTAIEQVKNGYSISVTHEQTQTSDKTTSTESQTKQDTVTDYTLVLKSKTEADTNEHGYDSYDKATNTYTWILTGRQDRKYTVKENNYDATKVFTEAQKYDGTYRYMIKNCTNNDNVDNNVWKSYDGSGVSLVAEAYPTDVPSSVYQTISFENRYVSAGDFTVEKIDAATQNGLNGVDFTISRTDNKAFTLWQKGEESTYYLELESVEAPQGLEEQGYKKIEENVLTTNAQGYFYIHLPDGEYTLQETVPLGYKGASTITMTVSGVGESGSSKITKVETDTENKWAVVDNTQAILTIKNESRLLTTVTALKQWNSGTKTEDKKPVTVQLWRNGAPMINTTTGQSYKQVLDANNNWQFEWKDLPLFIDGKIAEYSLREIKIGDTAYDPDADSDGYADYNVSYDTPKYCENNSTRPNKSDGTVDTSKFTSTTAAWHEHEADGTQTDHYANHALLVVNNSFAKGYISFRKLDGLGHPLAGATFTLYSDQECKNEVATATSQSDSTVQFKAQPAGTYYMKETKAPAGYTIDDDTVYTVIVSKDGTVRITKPSGDRDADKSVDTVMSITNKSARTLTLKKVSSTSGVQPLAGATFTIARDNTALGTFTTGSDGTTNFGGLHLEDGEYTISETKAPDKYQLSDIHVVITVKNGTVSMNPSNNSAWELTNNGNNYTLTVQNSPSGESLPSTGGSGILLPILFGTALMGGASALALWLRKRRKNG